MMFKFVPVLMILLGGFYMAAASGIPYTQSVSVGGNKMWYTLKFPTQYEINKISIKTDAANEQYLQGVEVYLDSGSYPDSGRLVSTLSVVPGQLQYDISTILNSSPLIARSVTVLSYTPPNLNLEDFVFHGEEAEKCAWGREHICDRDSRCSFGCHFEHSSYKYCWSQCDGACPRRESTGCHGCKEWCWLTGVGEKYQSCNQNSECIGVRMNPCSGACSI
ncbi:uncharacterized protein LOC134826002 [Bolinopsis microptera]|uniref:uncharacterized protein LOC134826002 n=1 Tax=Bolinopsis microptera TaxID=2820187 RepID=UPI00307AC522